MGAWGAGPFDSDASLDYLAALADQTATVDDDGAIVVGSVDHDTVVVELQKALTAVTAPAPDGEEPWVLRDRVEAAYVAAGLVAAVRAGQSAQVPSGTRLFLRGANDDPAGLSHHCGYVALLRPADVEVLQTAARDAVAAIGRQQAWLDSWFDPSDVLDALRTLEQTLT